MPKKSTTKAKASASTSEDKDSKKTKAVSSSKAKSDVKTKDAQKTKDDKKAKTKSVSAKTADGKTKKTATSKKAKSTKEEKPTGEKLEASEVKDELDLPIKEEKEIPKKEVKTTQSTADKDSDMTMEDLLSEMSYELKAPKKGDVVTGVITDVNRRMVLVDIGGKTEGMVVDQEYDATKELIGDLGVGDKVEVYVSAAENDRGQILLSLKKAAVDRKWAQFTEYLETGTKVKVTGLEVNRGGMIVSAEGLRGFVPSSQFGTQYLGNMEGLLESAFPVKVIEVDKEKNRLIFSEREVSEAEAIKMKSEALDIVKVDEIYEGVVSGIMPFGAFVTVSIPLEDDDKGQIEGLVHISEISWEKVNDPNDYFTQGDRVKVKVLGIDDNKLNLSVKQLSGDPWDSILDKYEVGTTISGKVTRVEPFGVFVTLEPGVDGLIHISKIQAGSEPEVGAPIEVVVDSVDTENRRMSLGMVLTEVPVMYK